MKMRKISVFFGNGVVPLNLKRKKNWGKEGISMLLARASNRRESTIWEER